MIDDRRSIAEQLIFLDTHLCQLAAMAHQKIHTFKLSLVHVAYIPSHESLNDLIKRTILTYVTCDYVLTQERFFDKDLAN